MVNVASGATDRLIQPLSDVHPSPMQARAANRFVRGRAGVSTETANHRAGNEKFRVTGIDGNLYSFSLHYCKETATGGQIPGGLPGDGEIFLSIHFIHLPSGTRSARGDRGKFAGSQDL